MKLIDLEDILKGKVESVPKQWYLDSLKLMTDFRTDAKKIGMPDVLLTKVYDTYWNELLRNYSIAFEWKYKDESNNQ